MKNLKIFVLLMVIINANLFSQRTFKYDNFELNKTVTFNNVVNYIKDKSKIVTEPSVYIKGEEIVYYNFYNYETTLRFFKNTQILEQISIFNIIDYNYIKILKDEVFRQLGKPHWGYEINEYFDIKDNSLMKDFNCPNYKFLYVFDEYQISCEMRGSGVQIVYDADKKETKNLLRQGYEWAMEYNKINIVYSVKPLYYFIINISKKEEFNYNKNMYPYNINEKDLDLQWAKVFYTLINKW